MALDKFHVDSVFVDDKEAIEERYKENKNWRKNWFLEFMKSIQELSKKPGIEKEGVGKRFK